MMAKKMNRSIEEYLANNGWSSELFVNHAKQVFSLFADKVTFTVGRSVIHLSKNQKTIKAYVHHNGRTKEYLTLTNNSGDELFTCHYTADVKQLTDKIEELLG